MANELHPIMLFAAFCAVMALAPGVSALIEGPSEFYGLEFDEPLYRYWNYTLDVRDIHNSMERNNFQEAAKAFVSGKNAYRNETTLRTMHDFTFSNLSREGADSFWGIYTTHFKSLQYLKDMIDPPLYGNGSYTGASSCCGVRSAAVDVYMRLWQMAFAYHENDIGVALGIAGELGSHAVAVLVAPVARKQNYWEWMERYSTLACIPKVTDPLTGEQYAPGNIALRDSFLDMVPAVAVEDMDARAVEVAKVREAMHKATVVQFMQVMMVEARKVTQKSPAKRVSACYKPCLKAGIASGAKAAWNSMQPFVSRSTDKATIAKINDMLNSNPDTWDRKKFYPAFAAEVAKLATSLGVNFNTQIWGANCKW